MADADVAVEFLLNNLKELLVNHSDLITNTRSQIETLETDLRLFRAFLKGSVKKRRKDEHTKMLVRIIRDLVYEAEDVIDAFVTQAMEKKAAGPFQRFWTSSSDLYDIGRKVEVVKQKVERSGMDFANLKVDDEDKYEKPKVLPSRDKGVVGFTVETEYLVGRLTSKTDYFDVVSLVGMFGLGKTTVAWKIFHDPKIIYEFPVRKWIVISHEFSDKDVFLAILKEFTSITEDISKKDENELAPMVAASLESGSFLIVFDDVRSHLDWDRLRKALPNHNHKGKVLITSRHDEVGMYASRPRSPHKLRFFYHDESWELLRLEALRKLDSPPDLEDIGHLITSVCEGVPLVITVIGGILATKFSASDMRTTRKAWEKVYTRVRAYIIDDEDIATRVGKIISLGYELLPFHLHACFLYLGIFPEDSEIPVSKLIRMWIGEGFIQQDNDSSCSLEETAENYLADLINRNLVRIDKFKTDGKVKTCRIPRPLRDFCRNKAGNGNENFLQEIKFIDGDFVPEISQLEKYRRLSIHSNCLDFISSKPFGPRVRSFVCFSKDELTLPAQNVPDILGAFKLLKVFDVKRITFPKINSDIYHLVHVRYLALSLNLSTLPSKFSQLWNIQTLIVDTTSSTLEVKADIWKMNQLRHFKTKASAILPKPSADSKHGENLQTLGTISVESCTPDIFDRACNLNKLGIRGRLALLLEGKTGSVDILGKMKCLEKLKLINDVHSGSASEGQLLGLPYPSQFPPRLRSLTLVSTSLSWSCMSILGLLKNLEVLKLKEKAFMGSTWIVDEGFRRLEFLHIEKTDLAVWEASPYHFPRLRGVVLKNCEKLLRIPIGLADVSSLQMLELYLCKSASASARRVQEAKMMKQAHGSAFKLSIFPPNE